MSIEVKNLTKAYGKTVALDRVCATFGGDQIYGLLGNNGAGKTTLLSIITDRQRATGGAVFVDGEPVRNNDSALGRIFLVGEQNLFPDNMRVRSGFGAAQLFYPNFDQAYAEAAAQKFGLNPKKKITSLSTGYLSIFRLILGLCVNTPYVIFDEPVLGLDAQHRDMFYRMLMERYGSHPATIILSTHLIAEVSGLIGHTVIIRGGRIIKDAPTEDLTADAYSVSGPAGKMDEYLVGKNVLSVNMLGGLKTASVQGQPASSLPDGLELSPLNLQDYFINLMEEEEHK